MKVPMSWLREYVDIEMPLDELATKINDATAEVEGIEYIGGTWDPTLVRVAEVVAIDPHPNADRLRLATVETGSGRQQVVCGAPNLAIGQKVAFATEGAELVDGHTGKLAKLKLRPIRGVESAGMVLSEKELGLSDDHEGILELPAGAPVGAPLVDVLGDAILDITTWANRADLLGIHGIAREVAALTGRVVREPESTHTPGETRVEDKIAVSIEAPDLCLRFTASLIEGVQVGPSPAWLQERLLRVGMRPINNVVDITNYVMLETGQPLHAFDYDLIRGKQIVARRAKPGEKLTTLDDIERELDPEMLLICDGEGPVGIAGIMGGGNSEVSRDTRNVLLEVANFYPGSIRRTSTLLKLRTEASLRFEKGLGPGVPLHAQQRALHLFEQLTGGKVATGIVDLYPGEQPPKTIILEAERIQRVLGIDIAPDAVREVLGGLGFLVHHLQPNRFSVQAPYWRPDVTIPEDVIEDLGRVYGYDRLPSTSLEGALPEPEYNPVYDVREALRDAAVVAGLQEVINYTLTDLPTLARVVPPDDKLRGAPLGVMNPVASRHTYLRTSLRGTVLQSYAANQRLHEGALRIFELGFEYLPVEADLPHERPVLCAVVGGQRESRWPRQGGEPLDFFDAKGVAEAMLGSLGIRAEARPATAFGMLEGHTAELVCGKDVVGIVAQVHPDTAAAFDIDAPVFMAELWVEDLVRHVPERPAYLPPERYPDVRVDLSLLIADEVPAGKVLGIARSHRSAGVRIEADIFDEYRGKGVPPGQRALAISLRFWPSTHTLNDQEVARIQDGLLKRLAKECGAVLRGS